MKLLIAMALVIAASGCTYPVAEKTNVIRDTVCSEAAGYYNSGIRPEVNSALAAVSDAFTSLKPPESCQSLQAAASELERSVEAAMAELDSAALHVQNNYDCFINPEDVKSALESNREQLSGFLVVLDDSQENCQEEGADAASDAVLEEPLTLVLV